MEQIQTSYWGLYKPDFPQDRVSSAMDVCTNESMKEQSSKQKFVHMTQPYTWVQGSFKNVQNAYVLSVDSP